MERRREAFASSLRTRIRIFASRLRAAAVAWNRDKAPRLGAAIAYYTVFSIAPLLVIAVSLSGLIFGHDAARGQIVDELRGLIGKDGAQAVENLLRHAREPAPGFLATLLGIGTLFIGASGVFGELQAALNIIWKTPVSDHFNLWDLLKNRFRFFTMVLGIGFLLLVSLLFSAALAAAGKMMGTIFTVTLFWKILNVAVSFFLITLLFAMIFKFLPQTKVSWHEVWPAAFLTSFLFTGGKSIIGWYLGNSALSSSYGAAGSFVVLLVWVYYSSQILLFGAELAKVYGDEHSRASEGHDLRHPIYPDPSETLGAHA